MTEFPLIRPVPARLFFGEAIGKPIADPKAYAERLFYGHPKCFLQARAESLMAAFMKDDDTESINILRQACKERGIFMEQLPNGMRVVVRSDIGKIIPNTSKENQIGG